jgi:hypothetical protein
VPFEIGMTMVAAISAKSFGLLGDQPRQIKFAERVFGDGPVFQRLRAFALREGPKAHLFAEQHALILTRIMIEEARDEPLGRELTQLEAATIARALLGCSAIAGAPLKQYAEDGGTLEEVMAILFQNGAYNSKNMLMGEMARVVELYDRIHHHPELLPSADKICPLDEWMIEDYGFSVEEQLRIGFSLGAMTGGLADGDEAGQVSYLRQEQLDDLLIKLAMTDRRERFFDLVSGDRATFQREFAEDGHTVEAVAWDRRALMRHPFLRCQNGGLLLLSPRTIQAWMGDGFYYRLLTSAQKRAAGDPLGKVSRQFTGYTGQLLEIYALELMRSVYPASSNPISGVRVYGEQPYGPGGQMKTSDVAVHAGGTDLVLFELSGARVSANTLTSAVSESATWDVQKMIINKVLQLDKCINALRSTDPKTRAQIPSKDPEVDMGKVRRIWPVVVTAGNVTQTAPLWQHVIDATKGKLAQPGVQALTLLHIEDYEALCYLIENGHGLIEVLRAKTQPQFAQRELAIWLRDDPFAPKNISGRPKLVEDAWHGALDRLMAAIDFTQGEPRAGSEAA